MPKKIDRDIVIERAIKVHGDVYDHSSLEFVNTRTKIKIICPEHGMFEKMICNYITKKQGCPECSRLLLIQPHQEFLDKCNGVHDGKYDYSLVEYINIKTKIKIICPEHGVFEQIPDSHLKGYGCSMCRYEKLSNKYSMGVNVFISISSSIHNDKYDYSLVEYINNRIKVKIICPEHGVFEQTPDGHINQKQGCPKCSSLVSQQELELQMWLSKYIDITTNDRSIIYPFELDVVIPSKKIAIEYNGLYWHSEGNGRKDKHYHINKFKMCKEKGYRLIQIWENEWLLHKDIIKSVLLSSINQYHTKVGARECIISNVSSSDARVFYDDNHIQGFKGGSHQGLFYNNELVSLMTISSDNELQRFVNKRNHLVHGAFTKLLKSFNITNDIITFADLRYFTGGVYENNGFDLCYTVPPRYWYFNNMMVSHRRSFQKKMIQKKFNKGSLNTFDPDKTEYQNMLDNGYDRIWDCGKIKFILHP